jgi:hypothetical protein
MSDTRYVAELHKDCLMIYIFRSAGICGPGQSVERPDNLTDADVWLKEQGFIRVSDWQVGDTYAGLMLSADLATV